MRGLKLATLLSGVALTAMSVATTGACAADLPVASPAYKAPVIAPFSWDGIYIGAHGGYTWGTDTSWFPGFGVISSVSPKGGFGGGQIGYNTYFTSNWLIGYELDLSGGNLDVSGPSFPPAFSATSKTDYFGTARGRVGYGIDHWLLYATAGTAWAHNIFDETAIGSGAVVFGRNQFYLGWTAGAGVEYALDRNWSVKAEYLYAALGKEWDTVFGLGERSTELTLNMLRLGVNYRFDGSAGAAPVASAYPVKAAPPVAVSPWFGSYIGVQGGYGWGQSNVTNSEILTSPADTSNLTPSGAFGGTQSGYNWHIAPNWVFGLDSDTSYASLSQSGVSSNGFAVNTKVQWFGSERVRLGFLATPSVLLYGTGGLGWAYVKFTDTNLGTDIGSFNQYRVGWSGGGGLEWAFLPQWSTKFEYLYTDLGTYQDTFGIGQKTSSLTLNTVKVGLAYHGNILATLLGWL
jgi:outer membrane immunogenic protein